MVSALVHENTFLRKEDLPDFIAPDKSCKDFILKEPFAEVWRDQQWIKVEIVSGEEASKSKYQVKQIDGCTEPFIVKFQELAPFGSHDAKAALRL